MKYWRTNSSIASDHFLHTRESPFHYSRIKSKQKVQRSQVWQTPEFFFNTLSPVFLLQIMQAQYIKRLLFSTKRFPFYGMPSMHVGLRLEIYVQEMETMTSCLCVYGCVISLI